MVAAHGAHRPSTEPIGVALELAVGVVAVDAVEFAVAVTLAASLRGDIPQAVRQVLQLSLIPSLSTSSHLFPLDIHNVPFSPASSASSHKACSLILLS